MAKAERQGEVIRSCAGVADHASAWDIASRLKIPVLEVANLPPTLRGQIDPLSKNIMIHPGQRAARATWAVAHELAEIHTYERLEDGEHEPYCQRTAAALMMPAAAFAASLREYGLNLVVLRSVWIHCSWQAVARRIPQVWPRVSVSCWEWERELWRETSPGTAVPRTLQMMEDEIRTDAYLLDPVRRGQLATWRVTAYRTDSLPNRAIVITENDD